MAENSVIPDEMFQTREVTLRTDVVVTLPPGEMPETQYVDINTPYPQATVFGKLPNDDTEKEHTVQILQVKQIPQYKFPYWFVEIIQPKHMLKTHGKCTSL